MKKFFLFLALGATTFTAHTSNAANVNVTTNPFVTSVRYDEVLVGLRDSGSRLSTTGVYTYSAPQARLTNGSYRSIFINATNGTQFCRALGHSARNTDGDGGKITCGEDESSFANYNFSSRRWESQSSGGANQCYPLYETIECR